MSTRTTAKTPVMQAQTEASTTEQQHSDQHLYGNSFLREAMAHDPRNAGPMDSAVSWLADALDGQSASGASQSALPMLLPYLWSESIGDEPIAPELMTEQLGVIIRGKESADEPVDPFDSHVDVVRSDGSMRGFFPDEGALRAPMGLASKGLVADEAWFDEERPYYNNGTIAEYARLESTYCSFPATPEQAARFDAVWDDWSRDPGLFMPLGSNCASAASGALAEAGVTNGSVPGVDDPESLYQHLADTFGEDLRCQSGYVDQVEQPDGTFSYEVLPAPEKAEGESSTIPPGGGGVEALFGTTDLAARTSSQ